MAAQSVAVSHCTPVHLPALHWPGVFPLPIRQVIPSATSVKVQTPPALQAAVWHTLPLSHCDALVHAGPVASVASVEASGPSLCSPLGSRPQPAKSTKRAPSIRPKDANAPMHEAHGDGGCQRSSGRLSLKARGARPRMRGCSLMITDLGPPGGNIRQAHFGRGWSMRARAGEGPC